MCAATPRKWTAWERYTLFLRSVLFPVVNATYVTILGAVLLLVARLIQGLAHGGELPSSQVGDFLAALDVFVTEPLPGDSPLRDAPNCLLTPHSAWYSEAAIGRLQGLVADKTLTEIPASTPKKGSAVLFRRYGVRFVDAARLLWRRWWR